MRPAVRDELVAERETLLAQLLTYVRSLKDEFSKRTSGILLFNVRKFKIITSLLKQRTICDNLYLKSNIH